MYYIFCQRIINHVHENGPLLIRHRDGPEGWLLTDALNVLWHRISPMQKYSCAHGPVQAQCHERQLLHLDTLSCIESFKKNNKLLSEGNITGNSNLLLPIQWSGRTCRFKCLLSSAAYDRSQVQHKGGPLCTLPVANLLSPAPKLHQVNLL